MSRVGGEQRASYPWGSWVLGQTVLDWTRPYVMGVLNVTPDSFSDGGSHLDVASAIDAAAALVEQGADIIDVGGESTRPGATALPLDEELERVLPVVEALTARFGAPVSIDTYKGEVAVQAMRAGADIVNDVSGGLFDGDMLRRVCDLGGFYICGHLRGKNLSEVHAQDESPDFDAVAEELHRRLELMDVELRHRTMLDPCLGFGKGLESNLELSRRAGELSERLARPVLIGASRKRFIGELTGRPVGERDAASVGAALAAAAAGAHMLRVHDVASTVDALRVFCAVREVTQ